MIDLERRLAELAPDLDLPDGEQLVADVLAHLPEFSEAPSSTARRSRLRETARWRVAAVALLVAVATVLVVPGSRRTVAEWFGLTGVTIEREPDLTVPPASASAVPAATTLVVRHFDVGEFDGRLDEALVSKALGPGTGITWVVVGENRGLWIDGDPHVVMLRSATGEVVERRFAGNTLLWQDGDTIRRVEGAATLDEALAYAATID